MTKDELQSIRERVNKATPGPWIISYGDDETADEIYVVRNKEDFWPETIAEGLLAINSRFIAHAREDVPKLLDEVDRLRRALKEIANFARFIEPGSVVDAITLMEIARQALSEAGGAGRVKYFVIRFSDGSNAGMLRAEDDLDVLGEVLMLRLQTGESFYHEQVTKTEYERLLKVAEQDQDMKPVSYAGSLFGKRETMH